MTSLAVAACSLRSFAPCTTVATLELDSSRIDLDQLAVAPSHNINGNPDVLPCPPPPARQTQDASIVYYARIIIIII